MARYLGNTEDQGHRQPPSSAVVLVNLGTPDAPTASALRRYLGEFLADPRVVELPRWLWRLILHGVILRLRPRRSAKAYASIWTEAGSPLLVQSAALVDAVARRLQQQPKHAGVHVRLAMSYGNPNLRDVLDDLRQQGLRRLVVVPLYPQYSGSTTGSVFDAVTGILGRWRWVPELHFITEYYREPAYIEALAASVREHWIKHGRADRLLLSFHGVPRRYLLSGDPYHCHCHVTARLLGAALDLPPEHLYVSFQSRVGREPWLQPYTDLQLQAWAREGVRSVQVLCPGFAVDCLETLEEIAMQNAEAFVHAGGTELSYIPALNSRPGHVELLASIAERHLDAVSGSATSDPSEQDLRGRLQRVEAFKAKALEGTRAKALEGTRARGHEGT